jgi:hypothetical protein
MTTIEVTTEYKSKSVYETPRAKIIPCINLDLCFLSQNPKYSCQEIWEETSEDSWIESCEENCVCKKSYVSKSCNDKLCGGCCVNKYCDGHLDGKCIKCNERIIECTIVFNECVYELCKKCCTNFDCSCHFLSKSEITSNTLDDYKKILSEYKIKIPDVLVDMVVDKYVDDLFKCNICSNKYGDEIELIVCCFCEKYVCNSCIRRKYVSECTKINCFYCGIGECFNSSYREFCINCFDESDNESESSNLSYMSYEE